MKIYSVHRNGTIIKHITGTQDLLNMNLQEGEAAIEGKYEPSEYFIHQGQAKPRVSVYDGPGFTVGTLDEITIPGLPEGTEVYVDGDLAGGVDHTNELVLSFASPGVWPVRLEPPFPWLPAEFEVTVT